MCVCPLHMPHLRASCVFDWPMHLFRDPGLLSRSRWTPAPTFFRNGQLERRIIHGSSRGPERAGNSPTTTTMRTLATITGLLAYCATTVSATALTYMLEAHERACFFTDVKDKGTKVAFYFAVRY